MNVLLTDISYKFLLVEFLMNFSLYSFLSMSLIFTTEVSGLKKREIMLKNKLLVLFLCLMAYRLLWVI